MLHWKVGNVTITSVAELDDGAVPGPILIPEATADAVLGIEWLRPHFIDDAGNLLLRIQALVVESQGRQTSSTPASATTSRGSTSSSTSFRRRS
jgi:hypothetical protein